MALVLSPYICSFSIKIVVPDKEYAVIRIKTLGAF